MGNPSSSHGTTSAALAVTAGLFAEAVQAQVAAPAIERPDADENDTSRRDGGMLQPQERITTMQDAFAEKHGPSGDEVTDDIVCAAAHAEIAAGAQVGFYLAEIPG